jgi:hypothetical protein
LLIKIEENRIAFKYERSINRKHLLLKKVSFDMEESLGKASFLAVKLRSFEEPLHVQDFKDVQLSPNKKLIACRTQENSLRLYWIHGKQSEEDEGDKTGCFVRDFAVADVERYCWCFVESEAEDHKVSEIPKAGQNQERKEDQKSPPKYSCALVVVDTENSLHIYQIPKDSLHHPTIVESEVQIEKQISSSKSLSLSKGAVAHLPFVHLDLDPSNVKNSNCIIHTVLSIFNLSSLLNDRRSGMCIVLSRLH